MFAKLAMPTMIGCLAITSLLIEHTSHTHPAVVVICRPHLDLEPQLASKMQFVQSLTASTNVCFTPFVRLGTAGEILAAACHRVCHPPEHHARRCHDWHGPAIWRWHSDPCNQWCVTTMSVGIPLNSLPLCSSWTCCAETCMLGNL